MREIGMIFLIVMSGLLLINNGVDFITGIYFAVLISSMLGYLFVLLSETKKANTLNGDQPTE